MSCMKEDGGQPLCRTLARVSFLPPHAEPKLVFSQLFCRSTTHPSCLSTPRSKANSLSSVARKLYCANLNPAGNLKPKARGDARRLQGRKGRARALRVFQQQLVEWATRKFTNRESRASCAIRERELRPGRLGRLQPTRTSDLEKPGMARSNPSPHLGPRPGVESVRIEARCSRPHATGGRTVGQWPASHRKRTLP